MKRACSRRSTRRGVGRAAVLARGGSVPAAGPGNYRMTWDAVSVSVEPSWPWGLPGVGLWLLLGTAAVLTALTVWTYLGVRGATVRRVALVLGLRLAALAVVFFITLRPSLGVEELEGLEPSKLLVLVDASDSMNTPDDFNSQSRWDNARRILSAPAVVEALRRLSADEKIEVVSYQGAEHVGPLDPNGTATGKLTPIGGWLRELAQKHGVGTTQPEKLRGLLLFSDGADNGPPTWPPTRPPVGGASARSTPWRRQDRRAGGSQGHRRRVRRGDAQPGAGQDEAQGQGGRPRGRL